MLNFDSRRKSLESLSVFIVRPNTSALVWASSSASEFLNAPEAGLGWNLESELVRRFALRSRTKKPAEKDPRKKCGCRNLFQSTN